MKDPDDYDPAVDELLRDARGNPITAEYAERVADEAEAGYDLEALPPPKVGRPSLSESGSSPQVRFRVSERTRHEALALAKCEGKTVSQLARIALESYLAAHRVASAERGEIA
jgi:hypothetical protein